ncbi:MAG TPA: amidohydrolase family protein [Xanthobacteraceae bacterium]|nr:amidohydrolase family protein [Xanthobacteraceae bacterium]
MSFLAEPGERVKIVDSQVHIWESLPGADSHAGEPRHFTYEELLQQMDAAGVDAAILVPRAFEGARNDYALEAVRKHPDRFAVMGRISLDDPNAPHSLRHWVEQPGLLGVRLTFHRADSRGALTDGTADWFWPEAERLSIPVMVHAPEGLATLADIAARHPRLRLILDHMGFARRDIDAEANKAVDRLLGLAGHPNIFVKVSAAPCYSTEPYPFQNIQRQIRRVVDAFGPDRCFWGSDLTRLPKGVSYKQCVTMFTESSGFLSAQELPAVMGRGLARCLGWPRLAA